MFRRSRSTILPVDTETEFHHGLLILLCYKRFWATKRTAGKLSYKLASQLYAKRRYRERIMPLGSDLIRAGGNLVGERARIIRDSRRVPRGKNGFSLLQGSRKLLCRAWRGGGTLASLGPRSAPVRVPA